MLIPSIPQVLRLADALDHFKPGLGDVAIVLAFTGLRWEEAVTVSAPAGGFHIAQPINFSVRLMPPGNRWKAKIAPLSWQPQITPPDG